MKKTVFILSLVFLFLGCQTGGILKNEQKSLPQIASAYYTYLMWKYYDRAAQFVDKDKAYKYENFVLESRDKLNITNYELKDVVFSDEDEDKGWVKVILTYYKYPSVSEKSIDYEDTWIKRDGRWYLSSEFDDGIYE